MFSVFSVWQLTLIGRLLSYPLRSLWATPTRPWVCPEPCRSRCPCLSRWRTMSWWETSWTVCWTACLKRKTHRRWARLTKQTPMLYLTRVNSVLFGAQSGVVPSALLCFSSPRLPPAFFSSVGSQLNSLDFFTKPELSSECSSGELDALDSICPSGGSVSLQRPLVVGGDALDSLSEFTLPGLTVKPTQTVVWYLNLWWWCACVCFSVRWESVSQFSAVSQTDTFSSYGKFDVFEDVKALLHLCLFN